MRLSLAVFTIAAAAVLAPTAGAKLTPAEQAWITPLLKVWNTQYAGGDVVVKEAEVKDALAAGTKPNATLTGTLAALIDCKVPTDRIKKAGSAPTARLAVFRTELNAACVDDYNGANLFAKAIGAARLGKNAIAISRLKAGAADFYQGRVQLAKAYEYITKIGSTKGFTA